MSEADGGTAGTDEFPFDAYISHGEDDREWVEEVLIPRLAEHGRRLHRDADLPPGAMEVEARSEAVAVSRKTLLVLSPAYLSGRWALFEEAVSQTLDPAASKRRLIPVLRGDCEAPLRVRPLVAVDLRGTGDPRQWKRLFKALDPTCPDEQPGPLQRASLQLAAATAGLVRPTWHPTGALLLLIGILLLAAAFLLVHLLLWEIPPLATAVSAVLLGSSHGLATLVWREDRDLFRRLSHLLAGRRWAQTVLLALALTVGLLWWQRGVPIATAIACGPLGCPPPGQLRLVLRELAVPEAVADQLQLSHRELAMKLAGLEGVNLISQEPRSLEPAALARLHVDYAIDGEVSLGAVPTLTAYLYRKGIELTPPEQRVSGDAPLTPASAAVVKQQLSDRLVASLAGRLGIELSDADRQHVASTPTASAEAAELNRQGVFLLQADRLDDAAELFDQALAIDPTYPIALSNLAEVEWRRGNYRPALHHRRQAVASLPSYAPLHYSLGHLLAFLDQDAEAHTALAAALELDPAHVPAYNELANLLLRQGEPAAAIEHLELALLVDPGFPPLHKNLGRARLEAGRIEAARAALERSLELYPPDDWLSRCEALALLVEVQAERGDRPAGCRRWADLVQLDPQGIAPWTPTAEAAATGLGCPGRRDTESIQPQETPSV